MIISLFRIQSVNVEHCNRAEKLNVSKVAELCVLSAEMWKYTFFEDVMRVVRKIVTAIQTKCGQKITRHLMATSSG